MDELIRSRMHEALDAIETPPNLRALSSIPVGRSSPRSTNALKFEPALGFIAAILALAIVAGLLYMRAPHQSVPSNPSHSQPTRPFSGMVTPAAGWVIGPGGNVFRTADGGARWDDVTPRGYTSNVIAPYFLDGEHAWIAEASGSKSILVLKTSDGGAQWQPGDSIKVPGINAIGDVNLFFLDYGHGWLLGSSLNPVLTFPQSVEFEFVYRTTDGGVHWQRMADSRANAPACPWSSLAFSSPTTGWMSTFCRLTGGKPELLVSHDAGATWTLQTLPAAFSDGTFVVPPLVVPPLANGGDGLLVDVGSDSEGLLLATSDGGRTWVQRTLPGARLFAGCFLDAHHGWVIAGPVALAANDPSLSDVPVPLYRTDDGGRTWQAVQTNLALITPQGRINDLYFVSRESGFAVAVRTAPYTIGSRTLYGTTDGGATWTMIGPIPT